jgi:hypothetical protein
MAYTDYKISMVAERQMHQWLDMVQDNLKAIEDEVASMESLADLDIELIRVKINKQYRLMQVLSDVATGKKQLVGTRQNLNKST